MSYLRKICSAAYSFVICAALITILNRTLFVPHFEHGELLKSILSYLMAATVFILPWAAYLIICAWLGTLKERPLKFHFIGITISFLPLCFFILAFRAGV